MARVVPATRVGKTMQFFETTPTEKAWNPELTLQDIDRAIAQCIFLQGDQGLLDDTNSEALEEINNFENDPEKILAFAKRNSNEQSDESIQEMPSIPKVTLDKISAKIDAALVHADPAVEKCIKNYANQDGFLFRSQTETFWMLSSPPDNMIVIGKRRYDFIDNGDGSVTFIEQFSVIGYQDVKEKPYSLNYIHHPENKQPIAIITTASIIKPDPNKARGFSQELVSDNIFILDKAMGSKLFKPEHGNRIPCYGKTQQEFNSEFQAYVKNKVAEGKKVAEKIKAAAEPASEKSISENSSITSIEIFSGASAIHEPPSIQAQLRNAAQDTSIFQLERRLAQQNFKVKNHRDEVEELEHKRMSDKEVIAYTTFGMAMTGLTIGTGIGVAAALGAAIPTFGLSLLAIPVFAAVGFLVGGLIGFTSSAIGCGLDRIARHVPNEPELIAAANVNSADSRPAAVVQAAPREPSVLEESQRKKSKGKNREFPRIREYPPPVTSTSKNANSDASGPPSGRKPSI